MGGRRYYIWNKIQSLADDDSEGKAALFLDAYNITKTCLDSIESDTNEMMSVRNNLLYYAIGYLTHSSTNINTANIVNLQTEMRGHLEYIEQASSDLASLDIDTLDTVVRAYAYTGQTKEAKQFADMLIDKCLVDTEFGDSEIKMKIIRSAREIINTGQLVDIE